MKIRSTLLFFVLMSGIALSAIGQTTPLLVSPEKSGLSAARLKTIDRVLNEYVTRKEVAGGVALIARKGQIGYLKSFGKKDTEANQPMTNDAIFRIASMTKAITNVAVMMLFEEGYFALDDPISKFIPEFSEMQVMVTDPETRTYKLEKAKKPITIRHLLNHTSGLTYDIFGQAHIYDMYVQNNIYNGLGVTTGTIGEMAKRLAKLPLTSQPGDKWQYGMNMDVLGYLIEKISGQSFDAFLNEKIFVPLGMTDTYFYLPAEKLNRLATLYGLDASGQLAKIKGEAKVGPVPYSDYTVHANNKTYFSGGAGLVSTATDYFKFLQMLLNDGSYNNKRILGRKTVELMTTEQTGDKFNWTKGYGFGFGFAVSRGPENTGNPGSKGVYTWSGIFDTHFEVDPSEDLVIILLTQTFPNNSDIEVKFKNLAYQALGN
jgi:CubicO group peptidase (beta-lactamase class C family)